MLQFFRFFRRRLIEGDKIRKYFLYAAGEIVLVVIGILLALQVDNWNNDRKNESEFRFGLKQLHKGMIIDRLRVDAIADRLQFQSQMIDSLMKGGRNIPLYQLPSIIQSIDNDEISKLYQPSDLAWRNTLIRYDPDDELQNRMTDLLRIYNRSAEQFMMHAESKDSRLVAHLEELDIPLRQFPGGTSYNDLYNLSPEERLAYEGSQLRSVLNVLSDPRFKADLKTTSKRINHNLGWLMTGGQTAAALIASIEDYDPNFRHQFDQLYVVGNATPNRNWFDDFAMEKMDTDRFLWMLEIELADELIKFRTDDLWFFNWGIGQSESDRLVFDGPNIPVSAGLYRVQVDLQANTFELVSLDQSG